MSTNGADYNVFGYDPEGRMASLVAIFYGPAWQPTNQANMPSFAGVSIAPPRYGAPCSQQLAALPSDLIPNLPPCYWGPPDPSYLAGPSAFNRDNFAAILLGHGEGRPPPAESLEVQYGRHILNGLPVGEVKHGVFWVLIYYVLSNVLHQIEFTIMSDMVWSQFHQIACRHLQIDSTQGKLGYKLYLDGHAEASQKALDNESDWHCAMLEVGNLFENSSDVKLEVVDLNCAHRSDSHTKHSGKATHTDPQETLAHGFLSSCLLQIDTYAFMYPTVSSDIPRGYAGLGRRDIEILRDAGIHHADDFNLFSPLHLCLSTGIEANKVVALYFWAHKMILMVHKREKELIQAMHRALD